MKKSTIFLGLFLIILSIILHGVHVLIFHDVHHMLIYLVGDIAFIPLEVFFVSMVLENMIEKREHQQTLKKINMIVGLFYQELGNKLLTTIVTGDKNGDFINYDVNLKWDKQQFKGLESKMKERTYKINISKVDLSFIEDSINSYQQLVTNIITNPVIHEHEQFTDVIMSIFHLSEELKQRPESERTEHDINHLTVDLERVYKNLALNWVDYLRYLQKEYPYLFLSAVTNNPFDNRKRAEIEKDVLSIL